LIRPRSDGDWDQLIRLAREVGRVDGYPIYLPDDDFERFLREPPSLAAWVAENDDGIAGHVALNAHCSSEIGALLVTAGIPIERAGIVARLFVGPDRRRQGTARHLLDNAAAAARGLGLIPVLDVVDDFKAAIALYRNAGWTSIGDVLVHMPDGTNLTEIVFRGPDMPEGQ
jgi:GNAT superfamily N-acetyltransferase